jgi:hypothetical protein
MICDGLIFYRKLKTTSQQTMQPQKSKQSLIQDAFVVLLEHLGPEKTLQLWHLFFPPQEDYVKTRHKRFAGMDVGAFAEQAGKSNRG